MDARRINRALLQAWPLPDIGSTGSKEDRGRVVVIAGSRDVPGAARLAGEGALRAGAGKLMVMTERQAAASLAASLPEAAVVGVDGDDDGELRALDTTRIDLLRKASAVLVGPGMATAASPVSEQAARASACLIADAGSLHASALEPARGHLLITPHVPEMADLMDLTPEQVGADPRGVAIAAAERFDAVVVLKGPTTWIAAPGEAPWVHHVDAPGLGTSGSGDVLAGVITGLVARGAGLTQAAAWGVALHARAGVLAGRTIGRAGFLASELLPLIPRVMHRLS